MNFDLKWQPRQSLLDCLADSDRQSSAKCSKYPWFSPSPTRFSSAVAACSNGRHFRGFFCAGSQIWCSSRLSDAFVRCYFSFLSLTLLPRCRISLICCEIFRPSRIYRNRSDSPRRNACEGDARVCVTLMNARSPGQNMIMSQHSLLSSISCILQ